MKKSEYDKEMWLRNDPGKPTIEDEKEFYNEILERIILKPRFYLDHLDELDVFYVSFIDYNEGRRAKKKSL